VAIEVGRYGCHAIREGSEQMGSDLLRDYLEDRKPKILVFAVNNKMEGVNQNHECTLI